MFSKKTAFIAVIAGAAFIAGCDSDDGSDFGPGSPSIVINQPPVTVVINNTGGGGGPVDPGDPDDDTVGGQPAGPCRVDNPNDPIPDGALLGCVASDDGASDTGATPAPDAIVNDPWALSDFFAGISAAPALNNTEDVRGAIDSTGMPIGSPARLSASFSAPAEWPPASATDATSLPVPSYIGNTSYIGAFPPGVTRDQQWTADWTIRVNGNDAVWGFAGGEPGTALAGNTSAPVADGNCPAGTTLAGTFSDLVGALADDEAELFTGSAATGDYDVCTLAVRYDTDGATITLTNDNVYNIADGFPGTKVGLGDDADPANDVDVTLVIEAGTLIYGEPQEALVVTRGATIEVNGTQSAPVVMTSLEQLSGRFDGDPSTNVDGSQQGEWAGFALMGRARSNQCGASFADCNVLAEGGIGNYGGDVDDDSSGNVNYLIIRHAGNDLDGQGNELNGFTLFGVGRNTEIQNVQIHRGFDDGIEFFGGGAFVRYLVLTGNGDDSLDYDSGWTGGAQNVLIIQEGAPRGNNGIEADSRFALEPITFELLANVTILGPVSRASNNPAAGDEGIRFREGKRGQVHNTIVSGDYSGCINFNDVETFDRAAEEGGTPPDAPGPHLVFRNTIVDCVGGPNYKQE
ncbi:hypothetical protein [Thioalkalivibrio sp. XN8]|uniref:hypothetical protein n=1 Tax=Thioalkalivibrio sp. XN8 TaxID=2712863 RepID=UPI0013ED78CF|nr:hypothetical protein [Thioalkalivibrio sp. XN8]NGP54213.1 hypothetical protein [Thioalkalivibrio sp. XN8]